MGQYTICSAFFFIKSKSRENVQKLVRLLSPSMQMRQNKIKFKKGYFCSILITMKMNETDFGVTHLQAWRVLPLVRNLHLLIASLERTLYRLFCKRSKQGKDECVNSNIFLERSNWSVNYRPQSTHKCFSNVLVFLSQTAFRFFTRLDVSEEYEGFWI